MEFCEQVHSYVRHVLQLNSHNAAACACLHRTDLRGTWGGWSAGGTHLQFNVQCFQGGLSGIVHCTALVLFKGNQYRVDLVQYPPLDVVHSEYWGS